MKLSDYVSVSDTVQTICLPPMNIQVLTSNDYPSPGKHLYAVGLDFTSQKLYNTNMMVYNSSMCDFRVNISTNVSTNCSQAASSLYRNGSLLNFESMLVKYDSVLYFFQDQISRGADWIKFSLDNRNFSDSYMSINSTQNRSSTINETIIFDNLPTNICAG